MADSPSSPATLEPQAQASEHESASTQSNQLEPPPESISTAPTHPSSSSLSATAPVLVNPSPNPPLVSPPPPSIQSFAPPSFRPAFPPVPFSSPQFSPLPNPTMQYQNPSIQHPNNLQVQPPGVNPVSAMLPGATSGAGSVAISGSPMMPIGHYQAPPGQLPNPAVRPYAPMSNGFPTMQTAVPQGTMPPPGVIRYPSPFPNLVRPAFPPRPPGPIGMIPSLSRPLIPIRGPIVSPLLRPNVVPNVPMVEKPQTTVYVGKIAPTVENDFILSLLQLCGPVKSWKRAQDPSDGTPRGFGFCEFESAEGVLRALRLLTKLSVDGQELVLNVNQATREYLERYVAKKTEDQKKPKENDIKGDEKSEESTAGGEKSEPDPSVQESKKDSGESLDKDQSNNANFGVINDEDREADKEATEKLTNMIEERLKTKPPPPPPQQIATDGNSNLDLPTKSKDGDSDADLMKNGVPSCGCLKGENA